MMKVDEWKHRYTGPRSTFQLCEHARMQEDVLATPSYRKVLVPDRRHSLTSGERRAKRRKIMTLADQINEGQPLQLLSVSSRGGSLFNTVARVLKERGEQWPTRERRNKTAALWEDVDDHMTILRKAQLAKRIEESPAAVEDSLLELAEKPTTRLNQQDARQPTIEPTEDFMQLPEPPDTESGGGQSPVYTVTHISGSPHRSKGNKSRENTDIRQRLLTKSFRGSKLSSEEQSPGKDICKAPVESPFVYHKKKSTQTTEGATTKLSLVEQHLNKRLPISPESGRTSSSLRKSLVHEMRISGAHLISIDKPQKHAADDTQWPGTQALIDKAQVALFSTPSKASPRQSKTAYMHKPADPASTAHRTSTADKSAHVDTQAILNAWSPWSGARQRGTASGKAQGEGTGFAKNQTPADKKDSLDWSDSNGKSSFAQVFDMPSMPRESIADGHDDHSEQFMEETEIMTNDDSNFQAAQDVSFSKLLTESQLGRDISEVAQNVLI